MLKNYWRVAWRNLSKNRSQSIINIAGLSVGMAVTILIGLWIYDECTFDTGNPQHDRIARVIQNVTHSGQTSTWMTVPYPLAEELRRHYGGDFARVVLGSGSGDHMLTYKEKKLTIRGGFYEPPFAGMLDLKMLKGQDENLNDPSSVLLSASTAKAYFGDSDPMGMSLRIDNSLNAKVAGVYEDLPFNSTFRDLGFIAPWQLFYANTDWIRTIEDPWRPNAFEVYVQLTDKAHLDRASLRIRDAKLKMVNKRLATSDPRLFLFPMNKWHLYSEFKEGVNTGGRIRYVWMFGIIGAFVLLLACINFMNLSTARSEKRAREVGIRKAVGSLRKQLILQFFSESFLVALLAFIVSLALVQLSLRFFNEVADKQMSILWSSPWFWLTGLVFTLLTGLVAGSYPALYLSSFQPVKVLKGSFRVGHAASTPRKALVVLQFTVSVVLIIGTLVVFLQIQFAKDRPAGYTREGLISLPMVTNNIHNHFEAVQRDLEGALVSMSEADGSPAGTYSSTSGISWPGKDPNFFADFVYTTISWDYGKTIGWQFKEGRDFSRRYRTDTSAFLLNEAAVRLMGLKHPVGTVITSEKIPYTVIGVVKDMIMGSPYEEARPTVFSVSEGAGGAIIARIRPGKSVAGSIAAVSAVFRKYNPDQPFEFKFVDDQYAREFDNEQRIGKLASSFAALAIFISCLGLFGMSAYMAEQRTREIGVRKVLGASVFDLWSLLSKDFVLLVLLSLGIAMPLAYFFMHSWLGHYHYHASITWWIFGLPAAGALLITIMTVSFQAIKAALANPVRSLRTE